MNRLRRAGDSPSTRDLPAMPPCIVKDAAE